MSAGTRTPTITVDAVVAALARLGRTYKGGGGRYRAQCPAHGGTGPNLAIAAGDDGRALLKCFSRDCGYAAILDSLGLGGGRSIVGISAPSARPAAQADPDARPDPEPSPVAGAIWAAATPMHATPAHTYLARRRVWPPADVTGLAAPPPAVRWLAAADAPSRARGWPGLPVGAAGAVVFRYVRPDGETAAVSLEALGADGRRMMPERWRRTIGRKQGSVFPVTRAIDASHVAIAEGEITAIAAAWQCRSTAWATGGTAGVGRVPVELLNGRDVTICADGDPAGDRWAEALAIRSALAGAQDVRIERFGYKRDAADYLAAVMGAELELGAAPADAWAVLATEGY